MSEWYRTNLNHNYFAYLDYNLWLHLDQKSPIASRLYELSLTKFHRNAVLNINYSTLAELLPLKKHDHFSQARRQLDPHFKSVAEAGILELPRWERRSDLKIAQLQLYPGQRLLDFKQFGQAVDTATVEETVGDISVKELRVKPDTPASTLVRSFYKDWQRSQQAGQETTVVEMRTASPKEERQAQGYIETYGFRKTQALMREAIKLLEQHWPDARTFAAVDRYIGQAAAQYEERQKLAKRTAQETVKRRQEEFAAAKVKKEQELLVARWQPIWNALPTDEQERRRQQMLRDRYPTVTTARQQKQVLGSFALAVACLQQLQDEAEQNLTAIQT